MVKNENPGTPEIIKKPSKLENTHYLQLPLAEEVPILYLSNILSPRTNKTSFKLHYYVYVHKFEEYFESCTMNTQNGWKSAANNSVNNLKN